MEVLDTTEEMQRIEWAEFNEELNRWLLIYSIIHFIIHSIIYSSIIHSFTLALIP